MMVMRREKDIIQKELITCGYKHDFYTVENNESLLQLKIECSNPEEMFMLGKLVGQSIEIEAWRKTVL